MPPFSFVKTILKCFSHLTKALRLNDLRRRSHNKCRFFCGWHRMCGTRNTLHCKSLHNEQKIFELGTPCAVWIFVSACERRSYASGEALGVSPCRRTTYNNYSKQIPCQPSPFRAPLADYLTHLYLDRAQLSYAQYLTRYYLARTFSSLSLNTKVAKSVEVTILSPWRAT